MWVIWDTFVRKWHMNSILFVVAMVAHDNLNICEPDHLEFFLFLLATFLN